MKRFFDLVGASIGLLALAPLFACVALAIKLDDRGPIFFSQRRVGRFGRPFHIHKFRTMVQNAELLGPSITAAGDPRVTPIGRWLRKTKLDELPQLFNVIKGEMSLVGPRPEVEQYTRLYNGEQREVLQLVPGMTEPTSLRFYDEERILAQAENPEQLYLQQIMPAKIRGNLQYQQQATVIHDTVVILKTMARMFRKVLTR